MGDVSYAPLIDDMTWSFSRVDSYADCPYKWKLKYIRRLKSKEMFYSSYGKFAHKLIEQFYNGELSRDDLLMAFLSGFGKEVKGTRPKETTLEKYINWGARYFREFQPFPYKMLSVEKDVEFSIEDKKFVGFIDFVGLDESDGEIVIIDHKSGDIKPRSTRGRYTQGDAALDHKLRQLYLYSIPIEAEYGKTPKELCFNCYRTGQFIREKFDPVAYDKAKKWALDTIETIRDDSDFEASPDFFKCQWICGLSDHCEHCNHNKER